MSKTQYKYRKRFTYKGKRYAVYANTLIELGTKIAEKKAELEKTTHLKGGGMPLKEYTEMCIETYKVNQKPVTRRTYLSRVRHCILELIGEMPIEEIQPIHCQQVINNQAGKSKTQISEVAHALNFIFEHAIDDGMILVNPAAKITKPKGTRTYRRALTAHEREHFIKVGITDRRFYFFLLMLYCGCRPSEAAECKGYDISINDGYPLLHIRGTKTANADRFVPIPDELYSLIKNTPKNEFIACTSTGYKLTENNARNAWKAYKRQLNISMGCKMYRNALAPPLPLAPDLVPYCLRHEYCTELARQGADIRIAQKLMGHSDIKLTANIYTNFNSDDVLTAAKILAKRQ